MYGVFISGQKMAGFSLDRMLCDFQCCSGNTGREKTSDLMETNFGLALAQVAVKYLFYLRDLF